MLPVLETEHVAHARDLIIGQFKKKRVVQGFLDTYVRRLQDAEDALWEMIEARFLAVATFAQLDTLGRLVGEPRRNRTDLDYRAAIRLRIRVNRSKGRITDIIDVASLAAGPEPPRVTEYRYLSFEVEIYAMPGERYVAELLSSTRPASSYGILVASDITGDDVLRFDDNVEPEAYIETFSDWITGTSKVAAAGYGMPSDFKGLVGAPYALYGDGPFGDFGFGS